MPDNTSVRHVYFGPALKDQNIASQRKHRAGPKQAPSIFEEGFTLPAFKLLEAEDDPQQDIQDIVGREYQGYNYSAYTE